MSRPEGYKLAIEGLTVADSVTIVHALMLYDYNQHKDLIIEAIYGAGNHHDGYYEEKLGLLSSKGILWLYGQLDDYRRRKLMEAVLLKYADESRRATYNMIQETTP